MFEGWVVEIEKCSSVILGEARKIMEKLETGECESIDNEVNLAVV